MTHKTREHTCIAALVLLGMLFFSFCLTLALHTSSQGTATQTASLEGGRR